MTKSDFNPINARSETEIFADLQTLCTSPGYIHAIAYFCCRDNLIWYRGRQVVAKDLESQLPHEKLLRTEISTLIGLMVQQPIELSLPEPKAMKGYIERTEALLYELHQAMKQPWSAGWDLKASNRMGSQSKQSAGARCVRECGVHA